MDTGPRRPEELLEAGGRPVTAVLWTVAMAASLGFGLSVAAVEPFARYGPPVYGVVSAVLVTAVWVRSVRSNDPERNARPGADGEVVADGDAVDAEAAADGGDWESETASRRAGDWRADLTDEQQAFVEAVSDALDAGRLDEVDPDEWDVDASEADLRRIAERERSKIPDRERPP